MKFSTMLLAGSILSAAGTMAFAADLPAKPYKTYPSVTQSYNNWRGFYAGINMGYGFGQGRSRSDDLGISGSGSARGVLFGGQLGYNWQSGNWVYGPEAVLDITTMKGTTSQDFDFFGVPVTATQTTSLDYLALLRGRLGYDMGGWMPYVTAGGALGQVKIDGNASVFGFPIASYSDTKTKFGWTLGAGIETKLTEQWTMGLDYAYVDLGRMTTPVNTIVGPSTIDTSIHAHIVRVGVNYRF